MQNSNLNAIYITGLSASGKTTLAYRLIKLLRNQFYNSILLDGTELYNQSILYPFKGHDIKHREDRAAHHLRIVKLISSKNIIPIVAFIGQPLVIREGWSRELEDYKEIYLRCDIETCYKRDNKNLYSSPKEKKELIVGVDYTFEEPKNPWLTIDTKKHRIEEVEKIAWEKIKTIKWINRYRFGQDQKI